MQDLERNIYFLSEQLASKLAKCIENIVFFAVESQTCCNQ